jgi:hypothetical protein
MRNGVRAATAVLGLAMLSGCGHAGRDANANGAAVADGPFARTSHPEKSTVESPSNRHAPGSTSPEDVARSVQARIIHVTPTAGQRSDAEAISKAMASVPGDRMMDVMMLVRCRSAGMDPAKAFHEKAGMVGRAASDISSEAGRAEVERCRAARR